MRKFFISFNSAAAVEKNTNEYNVFPKTNNFGAEFEGNSVSAAYTAGKGKSTVNNYYLYFRAEGNIYYFRSNPSEIETAKKGFVITLKEPVIPNSETPNSEIPTGEPETVGAEPAPTETPKRRRVSK